MKLLLFNNIRKVVLGITLLIGANSIFAQYTISGPTTALLNSTINYSLDPYDSNGLNYVYWWTPGGSISSNMLDATITWTQLGTQTIEAYIYPTSGNSYVITLDVSVIQYTIEGPNSAFLGSTISYILNPYDASGLTYAYWWISTGGGWIDYDLLDGDVTWIQEGIQTIEVYLYPISGNSIVITLDVSVTQAPPIEYSNENYILTITPQQETINTAILSEVDRIETITYFDGLGRPIQNIAIRGGGNQEDLITAISYDGLGRQDKEYLPYPDPTNAGLFVSDAISGSQSYYFNSTTYQDDFQGMTLTTINPFSAKEFEDSPINRVMKQAAPGADWELGQGHEIEFDYKTNSINEVRMFKVTLNYANNTYTPQLSINGSYGADKLYKTITKDENHDGTISKNRTTEEFKDNQGRLILKRTYADIDADGNGTVESEVPHDTYYVYDEFGNLTYVLPPKMQASTANISDINNQLNELGYQYVYDTKNRLVEKRIPGKGWEYNVYNTLDQLVLTQDAVLRADNKWLFTKYDAFGRIAYSGILVDGDGFSRYQMEDEFSGTAVFETQMSSNQNIINTVIYYTDSGLPKLSNGDVGTEILTINYYDNYTFDKGGLVLPSTAEGQTVINYNNTNQILTKGLATGSKVKVLDTSVWITTITGYDSRRRVIYTASENNYLLTTDTASSKLDFTGLVEKTTATHVKTGQSGITTVDTFNYDHMGRLLTQINKINSQPDEVILENTYDEFGQLESKDVGGSGTTRLQNIEYNYNIRGWLKQINDPANLGNDLFAFRIEYNDPDFRPAFRSLYNGNISETHWITANDNINRVYRFAYDELNRIKASNYYVPQHAGEYLVNNITYDRNGNLKTLNRNGWQNSGTFGGMDLLKYTYQDNSNKLSIVSDTGNETYGFKDDYTGAGDDTTVDYAYDVNGNMVKDLNKGIGATTTNGIIYNHLNLPKLVDFGGNNKIEYFYDATGVKLKKKVTELGNVTGTTDYAGNYIYKNNILEFFGHTEGYVEDDGQGGYDYVYQYKDHLGNIRLSYKNVGSPTSPALQIEEENNYYPFGLKHEGYNNNPNSSNLALKYRYNGKEIQDDDVNGNKLDWYDFGARNYDAALGRWMNLDPLAEEMRRHSPYNYAFNNPVYYIDPDGMGPFDFVLGVNNEIYWDNNANDPGTTKDDETYLGKELTFIFNSYIDGTLWDGPVGDQPVGDKLTSTITLKASENSDGELTGISASNELQLGSTPIGTPRDYFEDLGDNQNKFSTMQYTNGNGILSSFSLNYEQHGSVSPIEEFGLNLMGYDIVNVAQKLNIAFSGNNDLSISAATDIFPSATLSVNGLQLFQYNQPSFKDTHGITRKPVYMVTGMNGFLAIELIHNRPLPQFYTRYQN